MPFVSGSINTWSNTGRTSSETRPKNITVEIYKYEPKGKKIILSFKDVSLFSHVVPLPIISLQNSSEIKSFIKNILSSSKIRINQIKTLTTYSSYINKKVNVFFDIYTFEDEINKQKIVDLFRGKKFPKFIFQFTPEISSRYPLFINDNIEIS